MGRKAEMEEGKGSFLKWRRRWEQGGENGVVCWEQPVCKDNSHQQTDERTFND